jgi:hypothetical protein
VFSDLVFAERSAYECISRHLWFYLLRLRYSLKENYTALRQRGAQRVVFGDQAVV